MLRWFHLRTVCWLAGLVTVGLATEVHPHIDTLIEAGRSGAMRAEPCDDATFLRRVHLDFTGVIPSAGEVASFLADASPDKRGAMIDRLLAAPEYARAMRDRFHVHLMERRGDDPFWRDWLEKAFAENRPWDEMARSILRADLRDEANQGAAYFHGRRLQKYGANPIDYSGLTRDVGRLFLGMDLQCAECHNHRTIRAYDQVDFQGLLAGFSRLKLWPGEPLRVEEQLMAEKLEYANVFTGKGRAVGPRVPGLEEVELQVFTNESARYVQQPDRKTKTPGVPSFSPLAVYASGFPESPSFTSNIVNRVWFMMMGRGLVHPLDQIHAGNPASHPELLTLLATEFEAHEFDLKWLFRELARSATYQRSSRVAAGRAPPSPEPFALAVERRLSAEQLLASTLQALGVDPAKAPLENVKADKQADPESEDFIGLRARFVAAFSAEPREAEHDFSPGLRSALFAMNDAEVATLLHRDDALPARLAADPSIASSEIASALFLHIFSRPPADEDREDVRAFLAAGKHDRRAAIADIAWAMMTSTEYLVQH